ncbi:nucleotidyltransferase [Streptomyces cellostaticus]|uniref:Nucleotidyltransferase n=1 Tax=Streptomyces cellostaticus TaxID=67285 RepID=A0A101NS29_9ACTN|nr:nucleotidyltransferase domain-containing protein [Streptomyces cellostaticus]KUM98234.1 nucleotidyltransferase [Streptomyces cellostaticus]GHI08587.1 nucleotidyltransferase [Streptomyces cellostaticus]
MPTDALLDRFLHGLSHLSPLAVWAHGSLAGGDYQEGRSDLDLIAVLPGPPRLSTVRRVVTLHRRLRAEPLAAQLHCSYLTPATLDDPDRSHLTWAHGHVMRRPVTPVTRRELHDFGRVLYGTPPRGLLPAVPDRQLDDFVVEDQRRFWRPAVDKARLWRQDIWVDLGLLTFARATVTLRDGRLISKREALTELPALGAPAEVVEDIARRRYAEPAPADAGRLDRRAELTRAYLGPAIDALVTTYG